MEGEVLLVEVARVVWVEQVKVVMRVCFVGVARQRWFELGGRGVVTYGYEDGGEEERGEEGDGLDGGAVAGRRCCELSDEEVCGLGQGVVQLVFCQSVSFHSAGIGSGHPRLRLASPFSPSVLSQPFPHFQQSSSTAPPYLLLHPYPHPQRPINLPSCLTFRPEFQQTAPATRAREPHPPYPSPTHSPPSS